LTRVLAVSEVLPNFQPTSPRSTGSPKTKWESLADRPNWRPSGPVNTAETSTEGSPNGSARPSATVAPPKFVVGTHMRVGKSAVIVALMPETRFPPIRN
jgi:hypothetical protein